MRAEQYEQDLQQSKIVFSVQSPGPVPLGLLVLMDNKQEPAQTETTAAQQ